MSVVTAFLTTLQAYGSSVCLLHTGADPGSREWQGDIDLLVTSDRDVFLREMHAAAASLGFSVVLHVPRVLNTLEIDLLFPGAASWTTVFVDGRGRVLHVDAVFAPSPSAGTTGGPTPFGIPEIDEQTGLTYLVLKRLRKCDYEAESWARIAASAEALRAGPGAVSGRSARAARGGCGGPRRGARSRHR